MYYEMSSFKFGSLGIYVMILGIMRTGHIACPFSYSTSLIVIGHATYNTR